jgi:hypothetical protein
VSDTSENDHFDALVDAILASTPLPFVRAFLREHRQRSKQIRIGETRAEVRANLKDALLAKRIGRAEVEEWRDRVEGWGKQHVYISTIKKRSLSHAHLLSAKSLSGFLRKKGFLNEEDGNHEPASSHVLSQVLVDDEMASIVWRSHAVALERKKELDETRELEDGEYEFHAHRRMPRRSASRFILRKIDGVALVLIDMPLGEDHDSLRTEMGKVITAVVAPLSLDPLPLSPIVSSLDQGAVSAYGPKQKRNVQLGVQPTQSTFRTDGGQVRFKSTREATGYTASDPLRHVRKAMEIAKFAGEDGKFRLTFEGNHQETHDMVVSLHALESRIFLFSRMNENEVLSLVDQLIMLS